MNILRRMTVCMLCMLAAFICMSGCSKKKKIAVFTYEEQENGTLTITGLTDKGKMDTFLTVPSELNGKKVTIIGAGAFSDDANVNRVVISEGIETISENAFLNCYNLSEIEFPSTIERVGTNAFTNTSWYNIQITQKGEVIVGNILCAVKLDATFYKVPDGVKELASGVFYNNKVLEGIELPDSLERLGSYALAGCDNLREVKLPESLRVIGYGAFADSNIKELIVPSLVVTIGNEAFLNIEHVIYHGNAIGNGWGAIKYN